jgi:nucleoside-diphosphate-sugar epimerase
VLASEHDVFTNHIHADDLARACLLALWRVRPQRVLHVCDDTQRPMGDHFDLVADLSGLPRPPRLSRDELRAQVSPMQWSFLCESRRLSNVRMKHELGLVLRHPGLSLLPSPLDMGATPIG